VTRVCIAIPTYDGRELLARYLPSVVAQDAEVVVVDDGSGDGTAEWLAAEHPDVRVVRQANAGVSAALNRCLEEGAGAEYVLLLNNDVELTPGFATTLADALDRHPEAGSACGKMLTTADRSVLDGAGDVVRWSAACWRRGHGERDDGRFDTPEEVLSPCGGAAMYRQDALSDVGHFDADFVAYFEDVDWGLRAQLRGWSCRYEPAAVCFHEGSTTTDRAPDRHAALMWRNSLLLPLKDFPAGAWLRHWPRIAWHNLGWLRGSIREGRGRLHLRAWWQALRVAPGFLRKRREIQRGRRVGLAELDRVITTD
jgi:GT2 family glycosyltransferase